MRPQRARRKWLGPLLVLVALVVVALSVAAGVARSDATTTLPTAPAALAGLEDGAQPTPALSVGAVVAFTMKASDVGVVSSEPPVIKSPSVIVVTADSGRVLYERDADLRRPMASTTKIMTAILVLENLPLDQVVTVSAKAAGTSEPKPLLRTGDEVTVNELLYALMVRSSNGAAVALAEACDGSVKAFAARMNARAKELGMNDTNFMNPSGLDAEGQYSTAADMAKVTVYAMKNERFREYARTPIYQLQLPGRKEPIELKNTNKLLGRTEWVTGVKTGLTPRAKQCLVASATRDGVSVISVLLGDSTKEVCWDESQSLLAYGLKQYRSVTLLDKGTVVAESRVPYQVDGVVRLVTAEALDMELCQDDEVTTSVRVDRPLVLPVQAGEQFGEVLLTAKGETIKSIPLVADRAFSEITLGGKVAYFWGLLTGWIGG